MTEVELSGPINGLIILASALLAITQYIHNSLKTRFAAHETKLRGIVSGDRVDIFKNPQGHKSVEGIKQEFDQLRIKECEGPGYEMGFLFLVLWLCCVVKAFDAYLLAVASNASVQLVSIAILVLTIVLAVVIFWIGIHVWMIRVFVNEYAKQVTNLRKRAEIVFDLSKY